MILSDVIKKLRESKGLTLQDMAEKLYCSYQAYAHWEKGRRALNLDVISKLTNILGFSMIIEEGKILIKECVDKMEAKKMKETRDIITIANNTVNYLVYEVNPHNLRDIEIVEEFKYHVIAKMYTPSFYMNKDFAIGIAGEVFDTKKECYEYIESLDGIRYARYDDTVEGDDKLIESDIIVNDEFTNAECITVYSLIEKDTGYIVEGTLGRQCVYSSKELVDDSYYQIYAPATEFIYNDYDVIYTGQNKGFKIARIVNKDKEYYVNSIDDESNINNFLSYFEIAYYSGWRGFVILYENSNPLPPSQKHYLFFAEALEEAKMLVGIDELDLVKIKEELSLEKNRF